MRCAMTDVVFLEVPDEVTLLFFIAGCPHRCRGCHSAALWAQDIGFPLTASNFRQQLERYQGLITCVCFFGGEWCGDELHELLALAREQKLKTCLYSGLESLDEHLLELLDYVKLGPWRADLGGLDQPGTNQRLIDLRTGQCLNARFQVQKELLCANY